jgi:hypothetical protein
MTARSVLVVLFRMIPGSVFGVFGGQQMMPVREMSMMAGGFVGASLMMLGRLPMMPGRVLVMFGRFCMMLRTRVFRHFRRRPFSGFRGQR